MRGFRTGLIVAAVCLTLLPMVRGDGQNAASARAPSRVQLTGPIFETAAEFTSISSAVRFANGNVLVVDAAEQKVMLVDGKTGNLRPVGRRGGGPGEYQQPLRTLRYLNDQAVVLDPALQRLLLFDANGRARGSFPMAVESPVSINSARLIDDDGAMYFSTRDHHAAGRSEAMSKWRFPSGVAERVTLPRPPLGPVTVAASIPQALRAEFAGSDAKVTSVQRFVPYSCQDVFSIASGQRVIARCDEGKLEWLDEQGRVARTVGYPVRRTPIPDSLRKQTVHPEVRAALPTYFPAFDGSQPVQSVRGRLWLRRPPAIRGQSTWFGFAARDSSPLELQLPRGAQLVAVDEPFAVVVITDADDLQRLAVYRLQ